MTRRSRKPMRLVAAVLAITTVALSLVFPVGVGALDLERNCSNGLGFANSAECVFNVATPDGRQIVGQDAENENEFATRQGMIQVQANVPVSVNSADQSSVQRNLRSSAEIDVESGDSEAVGHYGVADLSGLTQVAVAGPIGGQEVSSDTGNANTTVGGDTFGGIADSGVSQTTHAGIHGGFALAAGLGQAGGDGGDGGTAVGGDGGDIDEAGNSGWAVDATLGLAVSSGGDGGDANSGDLTDASATGGAGAAAGDASVAGGSASTGAGGSPTSGSGGAATGGAGAMGGSGDLSADARSVGDGNAATATGTATSGAATSGDTFGHEVIGGMTGGNTTVASMTGGTATNMLGVTLTQSGDVSSASGAVTNSGAATASTAATSTQSADPAVTQDIAQPALTGTNSAPNTQSATSTQSSTPSQTISSGAQTATGAGAGPFFELPE